MSLKNIKITWLNKDITLWVSHVRNTTECRKFWFAKILWLSKMYGIAGRYADSEVPRKTRNVVDLELIMFES